MGIAETIDFHPGSLHLVSRTLDHPLLSVYVLKLDGLLFGTSDFGLRLAYVLAGAATLAPVYFLARRAFSPAAGLWAAALLAVDQFHAGWSRVFMPEALMLLFGALALLQFVRAIERGGAGGYALLGALLGLACLAKEPAAILLPAMWIYLLVTPDRRHLIRSRNWWLAHAVLLAVVAPDLLWNLSQWSESYLARDAAMAAGGWQISAKPLSLYLGELMQMGLRADALGEDYLQGNLYVCHWPAGLLYLASVAAAFRWRKDPVVRLLLVVFVVEFSVFLVLPGGAVFEPFWWASMSLIPAVVCAGGCLDRLAQRNRLLAAAAALLAGLSRRSLRPRRPPPRPVRAAGERAGLHRRFHPPGQRRLGRRTNRGSRSAVHLRPEHRRARRRRLPRAGHDRPPSRP